MPNELPERYYLLGPDDPECPDIPMVWNMERGWVGEGKDATMFDNRILIQGIPLPRGTQCIMADDGTQVPVNKQGRRGAPIV
jgi:hypothetical protein